MVSIMYAGAILVNCGGLVGRLGSMMILAINAGWSVVVCIQVLLSSSLTAITYVEVASGRNCDTGMYLIFDQQNVLMLAMVIGCSSIVQIYSIGYLSSDGNLIRFVGLLSLFTSFMLLLVMSSSFFLLFLGWEGIGIASYLLINFWQFRLESVSSSLQAMVINRISDLCFILLGILLLRYNDQVVGMNLLLLVTLAGKSAQIGLHIWLPSAIAAPTPTSSLIHAATLVTSGIFLLLRYNHLWTLFSYTFLDGLALSLGATTALFAALVGCIQFDIKKIIAYSTGSQLGYMLCGSVVSNLVMEKTMSILGFWHMLTHAFDKASLFILAGLVIHGIHSVQDTRQAASLFRKVGFLLLVLYMSSTALAGLSLALSGTNSKHEVMLVLSSHSILQFVFCLLVLTSGVTCCYTTKLFGSSCFGTAQWSVSFQFQESLCVGLCMLLCMNPLLVFGTLGMVMVKPIVLSGSLLHSLHSELQFQGSGLAVHLLWMGFLLGLVLVFQNTGVHTQFLFSTRLFYETLMVSWLVYPFLDRSQYSALRILDQGSLEGLLPFYGFSVYINLSRRMYFVSQDVRSIIVTIGLGLGVYYLMA